MNYSRINENSFFKCSKCNGTIYKGGLIVFSGRERVLCKKCMKALEEAAAEINTDKAEEAERAEKAETIKEKRATAEKASLEREEKILMDPEEAEDILEEAKPSQIKAPAEIVKILNEHVIGQHSAKRSIAVAIFNHMMRTVEGADSEMFPRSNILLFGPTGTGKTEIFRTISRELDIPMVIGDATTLTAAGYKGDDIESLLTGLLSQTDGDIKKAERGIVYIDEFDKICGITDTKQDGYNKLLQQNLLKLIEGKIADVPANGIEKTKANTVKFDTSNILFVCGGAFNGIVAAKEESDFKGSLGFIKNAESETKNTGKKKERPVAADFIKFGMIQEIVGRLPIIVELEQLTRDQLKEIMVKPKSSVYRKYCHLFDSMGIKLSITDRALDVMAERAMSLNIGARALNAVLEDYMENLVFEYAGRENKGKLSITKTMVDRHFAETDRNCGAISA